ncbi:GNAT family N-acetyltransferase [Rhodalgimonas zhirmunskyi]|uniref:GNAT family N-acetyltransferase n=1 Tax=Rhodalgimonas zhirmunskyi TaxID=2964767 RepID=A0AAJ1U3J6_9RHOB|nr:GNAT family N-acetyltransferase [Rhodoalgimonas zhirmunskyi]MDQ2093025.1 GNAT family N-acetyltransferase [Rhodoalgimonas zhirmunskyi]
MTLEDGFHEVPNGHLATVVTYLEMHAPVAARPEHGRSERASFDLRRVERPDVAWYRALFRRVGAEDWLWFSRLIIDVAELEKTLHDPRVEVYTFGEDAGLLELDFRQPGECELAFFGLDPALIGQGAGRWLMNRAQDLAWRDGINRFHLHTCTMDSPQALDFYRRSGFTPYKREVEVLPDPRLSGDLPENAAPQIPILR